jgi:hypothetical protein
MALSAMVAVLAFAPTTSAAVDTDRTIVNTTYQAVPSKGIVNVDITLKVTNQLANSSRRIPCDKPVWDDVLGWITEPGTCKQTVQYYMDSTYVWIEKGAKNLKLTSPAGKVTKKKSTGAKPGDGYTPFDVKYPRIFNGQTRTIKVSYTLKGGAPRSESTTRVNGGYVNFWAISQPVADQATLKVVLPSSFDADTWGDKVKSSKSGSKRVFSSGTIKNPSEFAFGVYGTDPKGFNEVIVKSEAGREIRIQGWPGDKAWMESAKADVAGSISELEARIGQPIPGTGAIVVREVATGDLGDAYAGAFETDKQLVSLPEDYSQDGLVAHELSHAWFNDNLFASQWLSEGHADWAEGTIATGQAPCTAPAGAKVDLDDWQVAEPRSTADQRKAVDAQYDAACSIVSWVANLVGSDRMGDVMAALSTAQGTYPGTTDAKVGSPNDWRQWLDAVDERGSNGVTDPSAEVSDLLVRFGVAAPNELSERADARAALRGLRDSAGSIWTIPSAVYEPMQTWDFASASTAIGDASATIGDAQAIAAAVPAISVESNPLREQLASADTSAELATVRETADAQLVAATALGEAIARAESPNPIESVGLIGTDVDALQSTATEAVATLDLTGAESEMAAMDRVLDGAALAGLVRAVIASALVVVAIVMAFVLRRRRGGHGDAKAPTVVEEQPMARTSPSIDEGAVA